MGSQSVLLFVHIGGKDLFYDALRVTFSHIAAGDNDRPRLLVPELLLSRAWQLTPARRVIYDALRVLPAETRLTVYRRPDIRGRGAASLPTPEK